MSSSDLPAGAYEALITNALEARLTGFDPRLVRRDDVDGLADVDLDEVLARHVAALTRRALRGARGEAAETAAKVELANTVARILLASGGGDVDDLVATGKDLLTGIAEQPAYPALPHFPERPASGLTGNTLLVNGKDQPRIANEVKSELASADRVDLLCAFVKFTGVRVIEDELKNFLDRGGRLRVITTTYMGATEARAVDRLAELGAEVKVSYDTRTTRLHAKSWLFHRESGYGTAYVGSSNLSRAAMLDGLEWNVRLSQALQPELIENFRVTFEEYWSDSAFVLYERDQRDLLEEAISGARTPRGDQRLQATLQVHPYGYQQEVLDELDAERAVHNRWRALVAMATGTGKTVVAGLDYQRLVSAGTVDTLLFVAHREEILKQSRAVFRQIRRDPNFGEAFVGGQHPQRWDHVFASIQSLQHLELDELAPERFDMVVVDEFHHAAAPTYAKLLDHLRPKVLLGLSATPERTDGQDITRWFDNPKPIELRLWEALERGLLAPFQYFGLHDGTNLTDLQWKRGRGYDSTELTALYTQDRQRTRLILQAVSSKVTDPLSMRAIGFCVSIEHARYMAKVFNDAGLPALAVTSKDSKEARVAAHDKLKVASVNVLFTVDLYNEGVDLPEVDTILFLRPTESATVFLQQLGRGLRLANDKSCLTVLDFIGHQHGSFRFDQRLRELTGLERRELEGAVKGGFPSLPPGCHLEFDADSRSVVLTNIKKAISTTPRALAEELAQLGPDTSMAQLVDRIGIELEDLYRRRGGTWTDVRRLANFEQRPPGPDDAVFAMALPRMLHIDDPMRLGFMRRLVNGHPLDGPNDERLAEMLRHSLWASGGGPDSGAEAVRRLRDDPVRLDEFGQLLRPLEDRVHRVTTPAGGGLPLHLHARYSRNELLAAFGDRQPSHMVAGVKQFEEERADVFLVTVRKSEKKHSPNTMYADVALSPRRFQWESQNRLRQGTSTADRYIEHAERGSTIHLFVREHGEEDGRLGVLPYFYAGTMNYVSHTGNNPIRFVWELDTELPADVYHSAKLAVG